MAIDLVDVMHIKRQLDEEYSEYHTKFRKMRDVYHGRYWELAQQDSQARSISSIFRDMGRANRTSLPPIRIVRNIIQQVCVKYQTFLSPTPMVNYFEDAPEDFAKRDQMSQKERYTYGVWRAGKMSRALNNVAWFTPLMGDAFIGIYPDMDLNIPVPIIRSPEHAYPMKGFGDDVSGNIFFWRERYSAVKRAYPEFAEQIAGMLSQQKQGRGSDPMCDVYEYSDGVEFARWIGGVKVVGVEHDFGFDLFAHNKFIDIPGDVFGHSAVEQAVNLNEADNMITSLLFQAMLENIFPTIVLIDPAKAPEELMKGPGSIIPINPGGEMKVIAPPVQAVAIQLEYLASNERNIQEITGMPAVNFGTSPASSVVTGAAVNELQGAGTGSTVQMVQQGLGLIMSQWCEKAIYMQKRMWPDTEITLNYVTPLTKKGGKADSGVMKIKGSDLEGGTANDIVWSPAMDLHDKIVMWLQAKGAGLVSDEFILKQIGIPDPQAMKEEIVMEEMERGVLGFITNQLAQGGDLLGPDQAAVQILESGTGGPAPSQPGAQGGAAPPGAPPGQAPPGGGGAPAGQLPFGGGPGPNAAGAPPSLSSGNITAPMPGGGLVKSPPLALPQGAPVPAGAAAAEEVGEGPPQGPPPKGQPAPPAEQKVVTVITAQRLLKQGDYQGHVWLVGEIVVKGTTKKPVEVALTDPTDKDAVQQAAPDIQFSFVTVSGQPNEKAIQIA